MSSLESYLRPLLTWNADFLMLKNLSRKATEEQQLFELA